MTTTDPTPPRTPAEALRWAAERVRDRLVASPDIAGHAVAAWFDVWARDLDGGPAPDDLAQWLAHRDLPPDTTLADLIRHEREAAAIQARFEASTAPATVYQLPDEPTSEVTELWDKDDCRWERQQPYGWCRDGRHDDPTWCRWPWFGLLDQRGPLSTTPPAAAWTCPVSGHTDVERDDDETRCLAPGCARSSSDPPGGRKWCECELYDCTGGCCGPGQCSCSTGAYTSPPTGTEG